VPDLVAVSAHVVLARVVPLRTLRHIDVQSDQVADPQQQVVWSGAGELEAVAVVPIDEFIQEEVTHGDGE